ncbi:MAG: hypothetical protein LBV30_09625 [Propionibacteriaceae bacterium]|jgi:hypothetical protein|nr:hypothetical protein [Propionibacteriaceae bacterium]
MIKNIHAEWIKLRRQTAPWVVLLFAVALPLATLLNASNPASSVFDPLLGAEGRSVSYALINSTMLSRIMPLVIGCWVGGVDWGFQTAGMAAHWAGRGRMALAKAALVALFSIGCTLVVLLGSWLIGCWRGRGIGHSLPPLLPAQLAICLATAIWVGWATMALAYCLRSRLVACLIGVVWLMVLPVMLSDLLAPIIKWIEPMNWLGGFVNPAFANLNDLTFVAVRGRALAPDAPSVAVLLATAAFFCFLPWLMDRRRELR